MQSNPQREGHRDAKDPEEKTVFHSCLRSRSNGPTKPPAVGFLHDQQMESPRLSRSSFY